MVSFSSIDSKISQHLKNYRTALQAGKPVKLSTFFASYIQLDPLIQGPSSLNYSSTRLPAEITSVDKIVLTPFLDNQENLTQVFSANRRRQTWLNNDSKTMYVVLNSDSDVDDFINTLISYAIELKKINQIIDPEITLLPVTEQIYQEQISVWWKNIVTKLMYFDLANTPVYFVSSNSHSLVNLIGGYINSHHSLILDYIAHQHPQIYNQWYSSESTHEANQYNDFLYHLSPQFFHDNPAYLLDKNDYEKSLGIITIKSTTSFPTDVQIIPIKSLSISKYVDANIKIYSPDKLANSNSLIINVQYPLGIAAKYLLTELLNYFNNLKSIHIIGKAAILNGSVGDIQIPEIVLDEVTNNIIKFGNTFNHEFNFQSKNSKILKNQKAACVYGTMLENRSQIESYQKTGFSIIEMESSNYLIAILEKYILQRHLLGSSGYYNIHNLPIDIGIINYASDNPLTQNLSHEAVDFAGIETVYLSTLASLQRIIDLESKS